MGEYEDRVREVREQNRWLAVERAKDDNGSHCCGAPVEPMTYSPRGDGTVTRWRCGQCGLPQDPR
jgi:hypothetical protein